MRGRARVVLLLSWIVFALAWGAPIEAVSFSTQGADGTAAAPAPVVGGSPAGASASRERRAPTVLPVPKDSRARLTEAIELVQATGFQARLAMMKLEKTETVPAPGVEIKARLEQAYKSFEALEKAARTLDDRVNLTRLALEGRFGPHQRLAALLDLFSVLPAEAFDSPEEAMARNAIQQELDKIAGGARLTYEQAMSTLSNGAKAVKDFAGKAKDAVKSGFDKVVGTLTTPVAYVHTKVSQAVGWENWAKIMAFTKCGAVLTVGTLGLVVAVTAMPATAVAAPLAAVGVWTIGNVGAGLSLVSDLNEIEGRSAPGVGETSYAISKGTAVIGLIQVGSPGEIFVNVVGGTMDDMTVGRPLTESELESFIAEHRELFDKYGAGVDYTAPDAKDPYGGGGGGSGGGGCSCN